MFKNKNSRNYLKPSKSKKSPDENIHCYCVCSNTIDTEFKSEDKLNTKSKYVSRYKKQNF